MPRELIRCRNCKASLMPEPVRRRFPPWMWGGFLLMVVAILFWIWLSA